MVDEVQLPEGDDTGSTGCGCRVIARLPLFTIASGTSLVLGLLIPTLYEGRIAGTTLEKLALFLAGMTVVIAAYRWRRGGEERSEFATTPSRYSLSSLFALTAVAAVLFALLRRQQNGVIAAIVLTAVAALLCGVYQRGRVLRSRVGAMLAVTFFPLVWVIWVSVPLGRVSGLWPGIIVFSALLEAELMRVFVLTSSSMRDYMTTVMCVFVLARLSVGTLLLRRDVGFLIYLLVALALSLVSSLGCYVGTRV